ncbi:MAG: amino acid racemase [Rhodothermales bacterium]|nr:amino acid racemase [Rhodothermales bacterium]
MAESTSPPMIGIIGGMGPYAGLDLVRKVFDETAASTDQEHLPLALLSVPGEIVDRTAYVLGAVDANPAFAIARIALMLEQAGATVAAVPCNSAHAPVIFDVIRSRLAEAGSRLRLLHMIEETAVHLATLPHPPVRVGVLSTTSVFRLGLYRDALVRVGIEVILPSAEMQERVVHAAVYDPRYGVKASVNPVSERAREDLADAVAALATRGAEAVILGCTEMPLALPGSNAAGIPLIDPTRLLARALIRATYPGRLRGSMVN